LAYDAAKVLADAIKRAGGTDSAKLKDAINSTKDFAGVTGKITIDSTRNAVKPAVVLELDPAASKLKYKETIAPEGSAPSGNTASNTNTVVAANSNTTK
jgi:branched-chain amino acid transport system substrate-binding protein